MDLNEFYELKKKQKKCVVGLAVDRLPEEDREAVLIAFEMADLSNGVISRWFQKRDLTVKVGSIRVHRMKDCACARA